MKQQNWQFLIPPQVGIVSYAQSAPGQGKTASLRCLAQQSRRRFLHCLLDQMLPEDIGGVPAPRTLNINNDQVDCVVKLLDETLLRAKLEDSIVMLDELNQVSHSMMASAQEWINNPPPRAWVFAAGNPIEQSSNGVEFTPPLVNRICIVDWERPAEARRTGWRNGFRNYPAPQVPIVPDTYLDDFGAWYGELLCDFEDQFPDLFGDEGFPKDITAASQPWPSDRSWTNAGRLCCAADAVGALSTVKYRMIAGCVGTPAAQQFQKFLVSKKLPDPRDLLAHPQNLKLPQRFDMSRAIMASVIGVLKAEPEPRIWEAAYDLLEVAFEQQPEVAMSAEGAVWKMKELINDNTYMPKIRKSEAAAEMRRLRMNAPKSPAA